MYQEIQDKDNNTRFIRVFRFKAFRILKLNSTEKIVFSVILSWCITSLDHKCYRTLAELLKDTDYACSNIPSLHRVITKLKSLNLIYSENKPTQNSIFCVNEYLIDQMEAVPDTDIEEYTKKIPATVTSHRII